MPFSISGLSQDDQQTLLDCLECKDERAFKERVKMWDSRPAPVSYGDGFLCALDKPERKPEDPVVTQEAADWLSHALVTVSNSFSADVASRIIAHLLQVVSAVVYENASLEGAGRALGREADRIWAQNDEWMKKEQ